MTNNTNENTPVGVEKSITRRPSTRFSGYKTHKESTGKEVMKRPITCYRLKKDEQITISFKLSDLNIAENNFVGFGGWFYVSAADAITYKTTNFGNNTRNIQIANNEWSAFGSLYVKDNVDNLKILDPTITFTANEDLDIGFYELKCGSVQHDFLTEVLKEDPKQLDNIHIYAPEANFFEKEGEVSVVHPLPLLTHREASILLKRCNRCARFLPVNFPNDSHPLSFSRHARFKQHVDFETGERIEASKGFQLECRFCKKFAVNLPLNSQRTVDQMKEDGARRRGFESLLEHLYGESAQLSYRKNNNGKELASDIWDKFDRKCFNCEAELPSAKKDMHLDHTRPLSLLWPLDATATCLCGNCNSQKSNQTPAEFYSNQKLIELSVITGIPLDELQNSSVNIEAVETIISNIDWLVKDFCVEENLNQYRDGKNTAELFLSALQRAFDRTEYGVDYDLIEIYSSHYGSP